MSLRLFARWNSWRCRSIRFHDAVITARPWRRHVSNASARLAEPCRDDGIAITDEGLLIRSPQHDKVKRDVLPYLWLRDNCSCTKCVNQDTRQRNFNTFDIPEDIRPTKAEADTEKIKLTWSDDHGSEYSWKWIRFYQTFNARPRETESMYLFGANIADRPPTVAYGRVMGQDKNEGELAVADMLSKVRKYGFVFVKDTPYDDPSKTKTLLERIAFIRLTHYGGFYDFIPDLSIADTAYTNVALPAHTDTTYFSDPVGLQALHLISHEMPPSSSSRPEGGKSLLVDGFHAAKIMRDEHPMAYRVLTRVRLPWHASGNKGITIAPDRRYPVLEEADDGQLHRVRWNNDDRGVVPFDAAYSPDEWYAAARIWDAILRRSDMECCIQLKPGNVLLFDNWRVLHGRSAFTGIRRMCGAYINRDDYISRWRNTNFDRDQILERIVG